MLRTAESVSPKHPDKICDQISDAILDEALYQDPSARVAVEAMGGHGMLAIMGEVTTTAEIDYNAIARQFVDERYTVWTNIAAQSPEIAAGVDSGGAGDQGIMIGYATAETESLMPLEYDLARCLNQFIYRHFPHDGKIQVTIEQGRIVAIVASFQHATQAELTDLIGEWLKEKDTSKQLAIHTNPAGDWQIGGFDADIGLTGRKLAVDNYGPRIPIGGGCFSGKDPSKVDRSAAYMARRIAVDYLRKHEAQEVYCHLAYAIGVEQPVQATVTIDGREEVVDGYDLSPRGIIKHLDLLQPQFQQAAEWGHFGHGLSWDK